jgi:hypothetical protein
LTKTTEAKAIAAPEGSLTVPEMLPPTPAIAVPSMKKGRHRQASEILHNLPMCFANDAAAGTPAGLALVAVYRNFYGECGVCRSTNST